jgi:hypothetical protein
VNRSTFATPSVSLGRRAGRWLIAILAVAALSVPAPAVEAVCERPVFVQFNDPVLKTSIWVLPQSQTLIFFTSDGNIVTVEDARIFFGHKTVRGYARSRNTTITVRGNLATGRAEAALIRREELGPGDNPIVKTRSGKKRKTLIDAHRTTETMSSIQGPSQWAECLPAPRG